MEQSVGISAGCDSICQEVNVAQGTKSEHIASRESVEHHRCSALTHTPASHTHTHPHTHTINSSSQRLLYRHSHHTLLTLSGWGPVPLLNTGCAHTHTHTHTLTHTHSHTHTWTYHSSTGLKHFPLNHNNSCIHQVPTQYIYTQRARLFIRIRYFGYQSPPPPHPPIPSRPLSLAPGIPGHRLEVKPALGVLIRERALL